MSHACLLKAPAGTEPEFMAQARQIVDGLRGRSVAELASQLKLGPKNAQRLFEELYNFGAAEIGCQAIDAFTGVVFKQLDAASLDAAARRRMDSSLRLVSSLYGLLRPADIIQSYRLDFGMKASPDGKPLTAFWKQTLTAALINELEALNEHEVLNLLPQDAAKCFDWKEIGKHAQVFSANFKLYAEGAELRTPHSDYLKRLRAKLLRIILTDGIDSADRLRQIRQIDMTFHSAEGNSLTFVAD